MPDEIKETLSREISEADYKVSYFDSFEKFFDWYLSTNLDVFLITNESSSSEVYTTLKKQYPDLVDCNLLELNEETNYNSDHHIYYDSENADIDIDGLIEVIDTTIKMIELKRLVDADSSHVDDEEDFSMEQFDIPDEDEGEFEEQTLPAEIEGDKAAEKSLDEPHEADVNATELKEQPAIQSIEPKAEDIKAQVKEESKGPDNVPVAELQSAFQNNPFPMRLRNIQKSLSGPKMDKYKTIGMWSPLPAIGVTSFLINFSLFLAENKVHTAVLESLTTNHILKDWLKRYTPIPDKWVSLATNLHAAEPVGDSEWLYQGVKFFPLNKDDVKQDWNSDSFGAYHRLTEIYDVTLIDMPTGEMSVFTKESLEYMDELWIIVDDRVQQLNSWKDYIKQIKQNHNISIHLIHNKLVSSSKPNILCEGMGVTMLTTIPALWEETAMNYYQNKPLYLQKNVQPILQPPYHQLATHLIGSSFQLQEKKPTMWEQIAKIGKFQNILNG